MMLTVYSKAACAYCVSAKNFLLAKNIPFEEIDIEHSDVARQLLLEHGHRTVPQIYLQHKLFVQGGFQGLSTMTEHDIRARIKLLDPGHP